MSVQGFFGFGVSVVCMTRGEHAKLRGGKLPAWKRDEPGYLVTDYNGPSQAWFPVETYRDSVRALLQRLDSFCGGDAMGMILAVNTLAGARHHREQVQRLLHSLDAIDKALADDLAGGKA